MPKAELGTKFLPCSRCFACGRLRSSCLCCCCTPRATRAALLFVIAFSTVCLLLIFCVMNLDALSQLSFLQRTMSQHSAGSLPFIDRYTSSAFSRRHFRDPEPDNETRCDVTAHPNVTALRPSTELLVGQSVWQSVQTGDDVDALVYSAFYDVRWSPPIVLVIGLATDYGRGGRRRRFCRLWFDDDVEPRITAADFRFVPETHGRRFAVAFYSCPVQPDWSKRSPYAVSLLDDPCQFTTPNVLRVQNRAENPPPDASPLNFTVCLSVLHSGYNDADQLVEIVEANRMFGADRFVVYDYATGADARRALRSYERRGLVTVVPWRSLPLRVEPDWPPEAIAGTPDVHYYAQVAAMNDCMYGSLLRSKFVLFTDVDELVVPRRGDSWLAMLDAATAVWLGSVGWSSSKFPGTYMIRNAFFRISPPPPGGDDGQLRPTKSDKSERRLLSLQMLRRDSYIYPYDIRSKYFFWSKVGVMAGIHFPYETIGNWGTIETVRVNETVALLHHYRTRFESPNDGTQDAVDDARMLDFGVELVRRTEAVHARIAADKN